MDNKELLKQAIELIEKGIITTSSLASGGKLNPEQADKFLDFVFDETGLKNIVRMVKMKAEQYDIDKVGVGRRVAVPKEEATDPGVRRGVQTSKISMNKKAIMVPFEISEEFFEDNIEGEAVEDRIARMMATQFANNLEELYINGDTLGPAVVQSDILEGGSSDYVKDSYLALQDGWMKLARNGNIVDAEGANISSNVFSKMKNALPNKYRKRLSQLKYFVPMDTEQNYRQALSARGTSMGDNALQTEERIKAFGVELVPLSLLEAAPLKVAHVTLTGTTAVQLNGDKNISDVVVHLQTLAGTPTAPIAGSDYDLDEAAGTIARSAGSTLPNPVSVKVTYRSQTEILLTEARNLILGIGRDIKIKKDLDIFKDVRQWAMTVRVAVQIEETEATVLGKNIGLD
jgi:hypothetical protein